MRLERITLINMRKHFWRVALLTAGLTMAVATVVTLYIISANMNKDFQRKLDEYGANIVIVPKNDNLSLSYAGVSLGGVNVLEHYLTDADVAKLKTIKNKENLAAVAPKLIGAVKINRRDALIVGVDFPKEFKAKKWWEIQSGKEPKPGSNQALLGAKAARRLGLKVGDKFKVKERSFVVGGILDSVGSQEDEPVYIDLKEAQTVLGRPAQVSMIEVSAWCIDCPITRIVGQAQEKLPNSEVSAVVQAARTRNRVVDQFSVFSIILSTAMALVGGLIIFTNMLASVRERRHEIGIFRAVGFRRLNILEIILFEVVIVALAAGVLGYLVGLLAAKILAPVLGVVLPVELDLTVGYFVVLGTLVLTLISSLYPALTAASLSPMIAINDI